MPAPLSRLVGLRIGDVVKHRPSGEEWLVARVYDNGDIIAAGWPCTYGCASDIEIVEQCSDEAHLAMVGRLMRMSPNDPRHIQRPNVKDQGADK